MFTAIRYVKEITKYSKKRSHALNKSLYRRSSNQRPTIELRYEKGQSLHHHRLLLSTCRPSDLITRRCKHREVLSFHKNEFVSRVGLFGE